MPENDLFLIWIKASKTTDQLRMVVTLGSTQTDLCLVAALLDYLDKRGAPGPYSEQPMLCCYTDRLLSEQYRWP